MAELVYYSDPALQHYLEVFGVRGSVDDWRTHVGQLARGNSRLLTAYSASTAGPLLKLMNETSCGFHFNGGAQNGKTITTMAAGSFWGGSRHQTGYMRSWRATANGLEHIGRAHNDGLAVLDEMSQVAPAEAGSIVYMLANGSGKIRSGRNGIAPPVAHWRTIILSSGEMSLADKLAEIRRRAYAGLEVRLIDIPANAGVGHGIFEDLHGCADGAAFANQLKAAALRYYGAAVRRYVDLLSQLVIGEGDKFLAELGERRDEFVKKYLPPNAGPQVQSVCRRFALLAVGGALATKLGIMGWDPDDAEWGVSTCFRAWLAERGIGDLDLENGIRQVRAAIESYGQSRFEEAWNSDPARVIDRIGFRKKEDDGWHYYVLSEQWKKLTQGYRSTELAKEMINRKFLIPGGGGKNSVPVNIHGEGKIRVYHLTPKILVGD